MTPTIDPMPPTITITRMIIDTNRAKLWGNTDPTFTEKIIPAKPARMAPITKASSFMFTVLTPIESATDSSSRSAAQARPMRECSRRHDT